MDQPKVNKGAKASLDLLESRREYARAGSESGIRLLAGVARKTNHELRRSVTERYLAEVSRA